MPKGIEAFRREGDAPGPFRYEERKAPITSFAEEVDAGPTEMLGVHVSGGYQGKPHSTKEGRLMAGHRELDRFFYGRKKKKPKGTLV